MGGGWINTGFTFPMRTALQAVYPGCEPKLVALGGSGMGVDSWLGVMRSPAAEERYFDVKGVGLNATLSEPADVLVIMLGMNDILAPYIGDTPGEIDHWRDNYRELISLLRARLKPKVIGLASITMQTDDPASAKNRLLAAMDERVRGLAQELDCRYLPVSEAIWDVQRTGRTFDPEFHTTYDLIHPNPIGQLAIAVGMLRGLGESKAAADLVEQKITPQYAALTKGQPALSYQLRSDQKPWRIRYWWHGTNEAAPLCVTATGDRIFVGSVVAEAGHSVMELDPDGHKRWGTLWLGQAGANAVAAAEDILYVAGEGGWLGPWLAINRVDRQTHRSVANPPAVQKQRTDICFVKEKQADFGGIRGLAVAGKHLVLSLSDRGRLALFDRETAAFVKEIPLAEPGGVVTVDGQTVLAVSGQQVVRIDLATGEIQPVVTQQLTAPCGLARDAAGHLYVTDVAPTEQCLKVFAADGQLIRDFVGPPLYGGGAALDPRVTGRGYHKGMIFDWQPWPEQNRLRAVSFRPELHPDLPFPMDHDHVPQFPVYRGDRCYLAQDAGWAAGGVFIGELRDNVLRPAVIFGDLQALEQYNLGDEVFGGWLGTAADGKVYQILGKEHCSVFEVRGLNGIRRLPGGTLTITTPAQVPSAPAPIAVLLGGIPHDWRERNPYALPAGQPLAWFVMAADANALHLAIEVKDASPFQNQGEDIAELCRSGDAVDLRLATQPGVPAGNLRFVIAMHAGKPVAVRYRYVVRGTTNPREFVSPTGRVTVDAIDVVPEDQAQVRLERRADSYQLTLSLKWAALGLAARPSQVLRGDVGVIFSDPAGRRAVAREYYFDRGSREVSDLPSEIKIEPSQWGEMRF